MSAIRAFLAAAVIATMPVPAGAQVLRLHEYLFWDTIRRAAGTATRGYQDYARERQLWKDKIEAAKREVERCGGCPASRTGLVMYIPAMVGPAGLEPATRPL